MTSVLFSTPVSMRGPQMDWHKTKHDLLIYFQYTIMIYRENTHISGKHQLLAKMMLLHVSGNSVPVNLQQGGRLT